VKATLGQRALRIGVRALQAGAPPLAVWVAERLFFTPPRKPITPEVRALLDRGSPFDLRVEGRRLAGWTWGTGPAVALVHGWGSRGGRLGAFVEPLVARGYRVVTYDGPGHGASDGTMSSMIELARALLAVAAQQGPFHAVVAHSLGASATTLALTEGLTLGAAAFLAPAANPAAWTIAFARTLGFTPATIEGMKRRSERRLRFRWDGLQVADLARGQAARLLVFHDLDDETIPWADGAAIAAAWPGAELVTTNGLGHRDIVRAPEVVQRATEFIAGTRGREALHGP
jgi:pimeloyl-ACP methyl ester carboxylesterase